MPDLFPTAARQRRLADIVFCLDVTNSMQNCINEVKNNIEYFIESLQKDAVIDFRIALVAYRDLHDTGVYENNVPACDEPWFCRDFTADVNEFKQWLCEKDVQAYGGGDDPESTLDAIYMAIHKFKWRENGSYRVIVLFTDSDTHPTLHPSIYSRKDNNIERVIQDFETMKHASLYIVAPKYPLYEKLEKSMRSADRKVFAEYIPDDDSGTGLQNVNFADLLSFIGKTITSSALEVKFKNE
jgi:hypothetical protein